MRMFRGHHYVYSVTRSIQYKQIKNIATKFFTSTFLPFYKLGQGLDQKTYC